MNIDGIKDGVELRNYIEGHLKGKVPNSVVEAYSKGVVSLANIRFNDSVTNCMEKDNELSFRVICGEGFYKDIIIHFDDNQIYAAVSSSKNGLEAESNRIDLVFENNEYYVNCLRNSATAMNDKGMIATPDDRFNIKVVDMIDKKDRKFNNCGVELEDTFCSAKYPMRAMEGLIVETKDFSFKSVGDILKEGPEKSTEGRTIRCSLDCIVTESISKKNGIVENNVSYKRLNNKNGSLAIIDDSTPLNESEYSDKCFSQEEFYKMTRNDSEEVRAYFAKNYANRIQNGISR